MKVIWKRPDGLHRADPKDYFVIQVTENSKIWLHKKDTENFPFRISGGWQDEDKTKQLNSLVNLLNKEPQQWNDYLVRGLYDSKVEQKTEYINSLLKWIQELKKNLKGDNWEVTIMTEVLSAVSSRLEDARTHP